MSADLQSDSQQGAATRSKQPVAARAKATGRISWTLVNFWLDALLLVLFVLLLWASAILQFVFPPRVDSTGWLLWGLDVVGWRNMQFGLLSIFATAVVVHVMFHWTWICGVLNQRIFKRTAIPMNGTDTLLGVGLLAAILHLLAAGLLLAWLYVQRPA